MYRARVIEDISDGVLNFLDDLGWGILVYNNAHDKEDVIYLPDDRQELKKKILQGWRRYTVGKYQILRAPEKSLCDLSKIDVNFTQRPDEILATYYVLSEDDLLQEIMDALMFEIDSGLVNLAGDSMETLIRVAGESKPELDTIPHRLYRLLKLCPDWYDTLESIDVPRVEVSFDLVEENIHKANPEVIKKYESINEYYISDGKENIPSCIIKGVWNKIGPADTTIFVAKSGIPFALGYMDETGKEPLILEYHNGLETPKFRKFFNQSLENINVNVVDKCYSGKTLIAVAEIVRDEGGMPHRIALFPKSREGVRSSEAILFLDEFVDSVEIAESSDWAEILFKQIIQRKVDNILDPISVRTT